MSEVKDYMFNFYETRIKEQDAKIEEQRLLIKELAAAFNFVMKTGKYSMEHIELQQRAEDFLKSSD